MTRIPHLSVALLFFGSCQACQPAKIVPVQNGHPILLENIPLAACRVARESSAVVRARITYVGTSPEVFVPANPRFYSSRYTRLGIAPIEVLRGTLEGNEVWIGSQSPFVVDRFDGGLETEVFLFLVDFEGSQFVHASGGVFVRSGSAFQGSGRDKVMSETALRAVANLNCLDAPGPRPSAGARDAGAGAREAGESALRDAGL